MIAKSDSSRLLALRPFGGEPHVAVDELNVIVRCGAAGGLNLRYSLEGNIVALRIPPSRPTAFRDGLWAHTCFELFVAAVDESAYREFNFSPSGEWAAYRFADYRRAEVSPPQSAAPAMALRRLPAGLDLTVEVAAADLPDSDADWQIGLSAVVQAADGTCSYWALHHPAARPDFHDRDGFALRIAAADRIIPA